MHLLFPRAGIIPRIETLLAPCFSNAFYEPVVMFSSTDTSFAPSATNGAKFPCPASPADVAMFSRRCLNWDAEPAVFFPRHDIDASKATVV